MRIKVLGYDWTISILSKKEFKKRFEDCSAVTLTDERKIFIKEDSVNKLFIVHELTHAVSYYTCREELELTQDQFEEYMCDFIALHGEEIFKLAEKILKEIR